MAGFNPNDLELTPMQVFWQPHGSTATYELGATLGNVKISVALEKTELKADQTGTTPIDRRVSGAKFMVTTELAQVNDMELVSYIFPHAAFYGTAASGAIQFNNAVGQSDLAVAGVLTLHPQNMAATAINHDWTFYVAAPTENSEITFGPTEQSRFKVEWGVYPDQSVTPYRFMRYGDKDL